MPCDLVPHFQVLHSPVLHFQRTQTIADGVDVVEVSRTCWVRPLRYEENQAITVPSRPYDVRSRVPKNCAVFSQYFWLLFTDFDIFYDSVL